MIRLLLIANQNRIDPLNKTRICTSEPPAIFVQSDNINESIDSVPGAKENLRVLIDHYDVKKTKFLQ